MFRWIIAICITVVAFCVVYAFFRVGAAVVSVPLSEDFSASIAAVVATAIGTILFSWASRSPRGITRSGDATVSPGLPVRVRRTLALVAAVIVVAGWSLYLIGSQLQSPDEVPSPPWLAYVAAGVMLSGVVGTALVIAATHYSYVGPLLVAWAAAQLLRWSGVAVSVGLVVVGAPMLADWVESRPDGCVVGSWSIRMIAGAGEPGDDALSWDNEEEEGFTRYQATGDGVIVELHEDRTGKFFSADGWNGYQGTHTSEEGVSRPAHPLEWNLLILYAAFTYSAGDGVIIIDPIVRFMANDIDADEDHNETNDDEDDARLPYACRANTLTFADPGGAGGLRMERR